MVYNLLHYEGLFVGASSALNMVGAVKTAEAVGKGNTVGKQITLIDTSRTDFWRFAATFVLLLLVARCVVGFSLRADAAHRRSCRL